MSTRPNAPPPGGLTAGASGAPPPPAAPKRKASPRATAPAIVQPTITTGRVSGAQRIGIYGTGGIGKTMAAAFLPGPLFYDLDDGTKEIAVARDSSIRDWAALRGKVASVAKSPPTGVETLVIDTATVAEELAKEHVIANRKTEKGYSVESIEGFGWGKGWQYVYEEFNGLFADLDRVIARGIHVCMIAHEVNSPVPNPAGEDFIRWEPHLYAGDKKQRGSIRDRFKQWTDHLLFIAYDVHVQDGKGRGSGTRTIYTAEMPTHIAKSRTAQVAIDFTLHDPSDIWRQIGIITDPKTA